MGSILTSSRWEKGPTPDRRVGDTTESWQFQLDELANPYRVTQFDNRGAGRTPMPEGPVTVEALADDAAGLLRAPDVAPASVAGFDGTRHRPGAFATPSWSTAWC
jgi:pimeloyl-ACP methyl ester carboxylesterase